MDRALVEGVPNRRIASQHGVTERAVRNHKARHLPAALAKARDAEEAATADDLLAGVRGLQERTAAILDKAEAVGELRTALSAIREARGNLELLAKLLGELDDSPTVNVLISPQWIEIRTVLLEALAAYPEARSAVAGELLELDRARPGAS